MAARTNALMAQLPTSPGIEPTPGPSGFVDKGQSTSANLGATTSVNPHRESAYDLMAFQPLMQPVNPRGMWVLGKISPKATALSYSFPTYTSGNMAATIADTLAPHVMLQDPMVSTLNQPMIAYITDIVSQQVRQQKREMDGVPTVTKPYLAWVESVSLSPNFRMSRSECLNDQET